MDYIRTMSATKHTPGPWRVANKTTKTKGFSVLDDYNREIANVYQRPDYMSAEREADAANARLIAAAPELLAALQMALPALEWCDKQWSKSPQHGDGINVLSVVRAVIAKAEGR